MRRAVFLDRDGVLNRAILREGKPYSPATLAELRVLAGVRDACRKLREAGFALILITNQPDIARGVISAAQVAEINVRLQRYLELDDIRVCPHDDAAHCVCRKPRPGMLVAAGIAVATGVVPASRELGGESRPNSFETFENTLLYLVRYKRV